MQLLYTLYYNVSTNGVYFHLKLIANKVLFLNLPAVNTYNGMYILFKHFLRRAS